MKRNDKFDTKTPVMVFAQTIFFRMLFYAVIFGFSLALAYFLIWFAASVS